MDLEKNMFLRRMGRKILVLHSYRDGTGRVCQRRLAHFDSAEQAAERLADADWQADLKHRYPELALQPKLLKTKLDAVLQSDPPKRGRSTRTNQQKLQDALRTLLRLTREDANLKALAATALLDLIAPESTETPLATDRPALEEQATLLEQQNRLAESCRVRGRLASLFPGEQSWADYGESLQRLGRLEEALAQYARLSPRKSLRHYQMASVLLAQNKEREALHHLALGMSRERNIADALMQLHKGAKPDKGGQYWERYGYLWDEPARKFFFNVYQQSLVKMTLNRDRSRGVRRRRVFSEPATRVVLKQAKDGVTHRLITPTRPWSWPEAP